MSVQDPQTGRCPKLWDFDDLTQCGRVLYFDTYWPAFLLLVSFSIISLTSIYRYIKYAREGAIALNKETEPLLATSGSNSPPLHEYTASGSNERFTEEIKRRHFDTASLPATNLKGEPHGEMKYIPRNLTEKFRVFLEWSLQLVQIIYMAKSYTISDEPLNQRAVLANLALWVWLLFTTSIRLINVNDSHKTILPIVPNLWANNFVIYLFLWFTKVLAFRSALMGNTGDYKTFYIVDFTILSLVFIDLLTSHVGYRCPYIYISDPKRVPAPEPYTSMIKFVTFAWIDPLIWTAYKSTLKAEEVWDLRKDDFSYFVVKSFKQFSERSKLRFKHRLILFFLPFLIIQAFWAMMEALIVFAPTILLRRILEFVDDRSTGTMALAWFYVFVMFFSKVAAVLSSGQALFVGRRVCIRLKSVVIGEIYAKALRRKSSNSTTTSDKADAGLQEDEEQQEGSTPKKSKKTDDKEEEEEEEEDDKSSANLGAIINLMAVDAYKVSEVCAYLHSFIGAICMLFVSIYLLYVLLGWSSIVGAVSIIAISPLNYYFAKKTGEIQKTMLGVTDRRIQKLNETFQAIRIIKFFAWEDKFEEQILKIRNEELRHLTRNCIIWTLSSASWFVTPTIVTMISFYCYIFIDGKPLTTPIAFTALSLFNLLRNPLDQISHMFSFVVQSKVSLDRVQEFLDEDETTKYEQLTRNAKNTSEIGFKDASFSWNSSSESDFKLRNLTVDFKLRKLNVIVGPTGAGKTSLLMALLGEMELLNGEVYLPGFQPKEDVEVGPDGLTESVAYCSQAAWLLNDSIRNNILFGSPYNKDRYKKVVQACGLSRDFEILKAGDQTEIGEKGIALSGGQKQRVSLARALYSNCRHLLLDDCLSAVDSHTALHIYDECITGPLMENRTVLLVSHNVALTIKSAAWVVMMDNGKISKQGTPSELFEAGAFGEDEMIKSSVAASRGASSVNLKSKATESLSAEAVADRLKKKLVNEPTIEDEEEEELENLKRGKLIEEETKSDGFVSFEVYKWFYQMFGGFSVVIFLLFLFGLAQLADISRSWWVRAWAGAIDDESSVSIYNHLTESNAYGSVTFAAVAKPISTLSLKYNYIKDEFVASQNKGGTMFYISIYGLLGLAYGVIACTRTLVIFLLGIRASKRIFKKVLHRVMRAKLRFFDATPIGRIMNRFSKDMESIDQDLVPTADGTLACIIEVAASLILITTITPGFFFFAIVVVALYSAIAFFYLCSSRELKRFDSITKSPIHQHFSETLVGVSTIRAYGIERKFLQENLNKIDQNNRPFFYMWVSNRWLSCRNDFVGALIIFFAGCFVLWSIDSIDAGLAGISLSYAITFNESALWVVRLYAEVEMNMNSVERLKEYLEIDEEPSAHIPGREPPASWPQKGQVEVKDLSLRYAPHLPQVIKNVSFDVEPENKIGIVGRTGAGKSTIITALFRFLDPETGYIKIDGVDITSIGLTTLRRAITIIPQDPTLFTGTIKSNLDLFDEYTDEQIFEALRRVNLVSSDELLSQGQVAPSSGSSSGENINKFLNLKNEVTEGGGNLSQGQRQLMCLARSLLRAPKIMLLDEATASIDYDSDAKIQQTIRKEFAHATILTIAHRLRSIIDYDKILVMDAGEVVEYDHPYKLLSDKKSKFYGMCADSGELDVLVQLSQEAFFKNANATKK